MRSPARGEWSPIFASLLAVLANSAGMYVQLVREIAELPPDSDGSPRRGHGRRIPREMMVEHGLLDASAVAGGDLRADGLDCDIATLCDVPAVQ